MEDGKGKIFVGGLPQDCPQEMLTDYFGKFGAITDVVVMTDRNTGRCRGFGFVTFESEDSVEMVMAQHADHQILGKWVDCKRATKEGSKGVPPSKGGGGFGKGGGKFGGGMGMMGGYGGGYGGGKGGYGGGYGDGGGMKGAYGGGAYGGGGYGGGGYGGGCGGYGGGYGGCAGGGAAAAAYGGGYGAAYGKGGGKDFGGYGKGYSPY
mmetsp:Transcript_149184/g.212040  ORF Transcript_149184/g.212040 Transcript_149184/m.212040 type:complete len:207 (-) Transcript_149184:92-712(-)